MYKITGSYGNNASGYINAYRGSLLTSYSTQNSSSLLGGAIYGGSGCCYKGCGDRCVGNPKNKLSGY